MAHEVMIEQLGKRTIKKDVPYAACEKGSLGMKKAVCTRWIRMPVRGSLWLLPPGPDQIRNMSSSEPIERARRCCYIVAAPPPRVHIFMRGTRDGRKKLLRKHARNALASIEQHGTRRGNAHALEELAAIGIKIASILQQHLGFVVDATV